MAAAEGNEYAREGRRWREAIKRALSRAGGDINAGLDKLASSLVNQALDGKPWAIEHIAERLDGKAVQHISGTVEHNVNVGSGETLTPAIARALQARTDNTVQ